MLENNDYINSNGMGKQQFNKINQNRDSRGNIIAISISNSVKNNITI